MVFSRSVFKVNMKHNYTDIDISENEDKSEIVRNCNDCGAYAILPKKVKHYDSCKIGESKKWEKFYENANDEELEYIKSLNK